MEEIVPVDFTSYWYALRLFASDQDPYSYSFLSTLAGIEGAKYTPFPFFYHPIFLFLFRPLLFFEPKTAFLIFCTLQILTFFLAIKTLKLSWNRLFLVCFSPTLYTNFFGAGQINLLLASLLLLSFFLRFSNQTKERFLTALFFSATILIKPAMILFLPAFMIKDLIYRPQKNLQEERAIPDCNVTSDKRPESPLKKKYAWKSMFLNFASVACFCVFLSLPFPELTILWLGKILAYLEGNTHLFSPTLCLNTSLYGLFLRLELEPFLVLPILILLYVSVFVKLILQKESLRNRTLLPKNISDLIFGNFLYEISLIFCLFGTYSWNHYLIFPVVFLLITKQKKTSVFLLFLCVLDPIGLLPPPWNGYAIPVLLLTLCFYHLPGSDRDFLLHNNKSVF